MRRILAAILTLGLIFGVSSACGGGGGQPGATGIPGY